MKHFWRNACLLLAAVVLSACGASRNAYPDAALDLEKLTGGSYLTGCVSGNRLWAARSYELELWTLPQTVSPSLDQRIPTDMPPNGHAVTQIACTTNRALALLDNGEALGLDVTGIAWRGHVEDAATWPQITDNHHQIPPTGSRWAARMNDGREVLLGDWGRGTRFNNTILDWRPAAGNLREAVWDGKYIWAVSDTSLWRWDPAQGGPTPVVLPDLLNERIFTGVFRDSAASDNSNVSRLWIRDSENLGWPIRITGVRASLIAGKGPLSPVDPHWRLAIMGGQAEATKGYSGLTLTSPQGARAVINTQPITSIAQADDQTLITAEGSELVIRALDAEFKLHELARFKLGSETRQVLAVPQASPEYLTAKANYDLKLAEYRERKSKGLYASKPTPPEAPDKIDVMLYLIGAEYGFASLRLKLNYTK